MSDLNICNILWKNITLLFNVCNHCVQAYVCVFTVFETACVCDYNCLTTASVAVIPPGYKHHQSPEEVTLFITALFVALLQILYHRTTKSSATCHERRLSASWLHHFKMTIINQFQLGEDLHKERCMICDDMMNVFVRLKIKVSDWWNEGAVFRSHALLRVVSLAIFQLPDTPAES